MAAIERCLADGGWKKGIEMLRRQRRRKQGLGGPNLLLQDLRLRRRLT